MQEWSCRSDCQTYPRAWPADVVAPSASRHEAASGGSAVHPYGTHVPERVAAGLKRGPKPAAIVASRATILTIVLRRPGPQSTAASPPPPRPSTTPPLPPLPLPPPPPPLPPPPASTATAKRPGPWCAAKRRRANMLLPRAAQRGPAGGPWRCSGGKDQVALPSGDRGSVGNPHVPEEH